METTTTIETTVPSGTADSADSPVLQQTAAVRDAAPFSTEQMAEIEEKLVRDGFVHLPGILTPAEIEAAREGIDRIFSDEKYREAYNVELDFIALRLFETDPFFVDMLTREPILSLAEYILGPNCHVMAQNAMRNMPGKTIDTFHVDDAVIFELPESIERHDPRLRLPIFYYNCMFALTDIPSIEYGPTQFIPGSHYSGRNPNDPLHPNFEGREPVSILCKAGDAYLFNGQGWHRGAPNTSDRTRYVFGMTFSKRFIAQRFFPYVDYQLPQQVFERADDRCKRVLGFHPKGAYG
jgi:hypothetical protein